MGVVGFGSEVEGDAGDLGDLDLVGVDEGEAGADGGVAAGDEVAVGDGGAAEDGVVAAVWGLDDDVFELGWGV